MKHDLALAYAMKRRARSAGQKRPVEPDMPEAADLSPVLADDAPEAEAEPMQPVSAVARIVAKHKRTPKLGLAVATPGADDEN